VQRDRFSGRKDVFDKIDAEKNKVRKRAIELEEQGKLN